MRMPLSSAFLAPPLAASHLWSPRQKVTEWISAASRKSCWSQNLVLVYGPQAPDGVGCRRARDYGSEVCLAETTMWCVRRGGICKYAVPISPNL